MSYILDALRRADAERQLGRAPDLHAQPLPAGVLDERTGPTRRPLAWLAGGAAALAAGLLAAWLALSWWRAPPDAPAVTRADPVVATPTPSPPVPSPPPVLPASPEPAPPGNVARDIAAGAATGRAPAPAEATAARSSLPPLPAPTPPAPTPAGTVPMPGVAAPPTTAAAPGPPAAPVAAAAPAAVPPLRERPDLQRELPPIVFGGSVYSEQASARIVVLNGRVFREGETIMPDLVVDEIGPRGAVLRWRAQRFSLP